MPLEDSVLRMRSGFLETPRTPSATRMFLLRHKSAPLHCLGVEHWHVETENDSNDGYLAAGLFDTM
jgi:hypothetical protein